MFSDRRTRHDRVDLQIFGLIVPLLAGDVVREAERGAASDSKGDLNGGLCRAPHCASQEHDGAGEDCAPSHISSKLELRKE